MSAGCIIDAPEGGITTYASWYSRLWGQEPITLQAFLNLLGIRRFFLDSSQQLPALLDESLKHQDEVTDALGEQVRRAVEVLVQALDKADQDRGRELLREVEPEELYEASLTVMMRLVFLLSAEERDLLLLGDERYESYYAVSTLRMQLSEQADLHSEEILAQRRDAWSRLLAIFRAVYGGVEHEKLRMPALGGSLFDPDRFPFLEGRAKGTNWRQDQAQPLPIDNRTVMLLLEAIQLFKGRTLSYRALDVEQIGYVYEGLLERTVVRASDVTLELKAGKKVKQPWVTWGELEDARLSGDKAVEKLLAERTGSKAIKSRFQKAITDADQNKLLTACHGDQELRDRLAPYFNFLRIDPWGYPLIYPKGAFMVATGSDRRETGTHYTPKSLTESIVKETLEPVVYVGPAEGHERQDWQLKSPSELLDLKVCDLAMGSGAFLVQVCRWLAERLLEAWALAEAQGKSITADGVVVEQISSHEPLTTDAEERSVTARRLISERCLYGVDVNPLAVELAKLSIWLVTLAKGRPFGFLDHNLRDGDSILGITNLDQLHYLDMNVGKGSEKKLFAQKIDKALKEAIELRMELRQRPILDIRDVEVMAHLDQQAREKLDLTELVADVLVGETLNAGNKKVDVTMISIEAGQAFEGDDEARRKLEEKVNVLMKQDLPKGKPQRKAFHWSLEFPEVFTRVNSGFDALVGNPPFLGNKSWKSTFGPKMQQQAKMVLNSKPGKIDLSLVFHRRSLELIRENGGYGLLATAGITRGDAIPVGLGYISKYGVIYSAEKMVNWPGDAGVHASKVVMRKGEYNSPRIVDGVVCERISPRLTAEYGEEWEPQKLTAGFWGFEGIHNGKGQSFLLEEKDGWFGKLLSEKDSLLRPYFSGEDITGHALIKKKRYALDILDMNLKEIEAKWPVAYDFLNVVVKSNRNEVELESYKGLIDRWWQFWNHRASQYKRLRIHDKCIVFSKNTKYPLGILAPSSWIYTNKVVLMSIDRPDTLSICLSNFFQKWIEKYGGGIRSTLTISLSKSVETFPLPDRFVEKEAVEAASSWERLAIEWCNNNDKGITDLMNSYHSPDIQGDLIEKLRSLTKVIDQGVLQAYGWNEFELTYDITEIPGMAENEKYRYGWPDDISNQLLGRLLVLNKSQALRQAEDNKPGAGNKVKTKVYELPKPNRCEVLQVAEPSPQMNIFGQEDE